MVRTLPWLSSSPSSKSPARARPGKRQRTYSGDSAGITTPFDRQTQPEVPGQFAPTTTSAPRDVVTSGREAVSSRTGDDAGSRLRSDRVPSTSPPPETPELEYMREGLDADDIYVMVEDEFYDVAKSFTAHLHQAEYVRQRQLARDRNTHSSTGTALPVNGRKDPGRDVLQEKARKRRDRDMKTTLTGALGGKSEVESDHSSDEKAHARDDTANQCMGTSLFGLMTSPSKSHKSLVGLHGPTLNTRASAGFQRVQNTPTKKKRGLGLWKKPVEVVKTESPTEESASASEGDLDVMPKKLYRVRVESPSPEDRAAQSMEFKVSKASSIKSRKLSELTGRSGSSQSQF